MFRHNGDPGRLNKLRRHSPPCRAFALRMSFRKACAPLSHPNGQVRRGPRLLDTHAASELRRSVRRHLPPTERRHRSLQKGHIQPVKTIQIVIYISVFIHFVLNKTRNVKIYLLFIAYSVRIDFIISREIPFISPPPSSSFISPSPRQTRVAPALLQDSSFSGNPPALPDSLDTI